MRNPCPVPTAVTAAVIALAGFTPSSAGEGPT